MRGSPEQTFQAILWFAGLVVALGVAAGVFAWGRSRWRRRGQGDGGTFSLDQLRAMRDRGELSSDEFDRLRAGAIAAFKSQGTEKKR